MNSTIQILHLLMIIPTIKLRIYKMTHLKLLFTSFTFLFIHIFGDCELNTDYKSIKSEQNRSLQLSSIKQNNEIQKKQDNYAIRNLEHSVSDNLTDSMVTYSWNPDLERWVYSRKIIYVYDEFEATTSEYHWDWNENLNCWDRNYYLNIAYENNKEIIIEFNWSNNTWVKKYKIINVYNNYGSTLEFVRYRWIDELGDWLPVRKSTYGYDDGNRLISLMRYKWDSDRSKWGNYIKYTQSDMINQFNINLLGYIWDTASNGWNLKYKWEYRFDENGNETNYASYVLDTISDTWEGKYKDITSYDDYNREISNLQYNYFESLEEWVFTYRTEKKYNEEGNNDKKITYDWSISKNAWVHEKKIINTFQDNTRIRRVFYSWDEKSNSWIYSSKVVYYVSGLSETNSNKHDNSIFKLYPNPTSGILNIDIDNNSNYSIIIYSISGKIMLEKVNCNNRIIDIDKLQDGMYLYKIEQTTKTIRGKLIIKK